MAARVVIAVQLILLFAAGVHTYGMLNPDAISYIRVAEHLLAGRPDLAVNGYWSPLFSWLLVPPLAAGIDPMLACRALMVLSGAAYSLGSYCFICALTPSARLRTAALGAAALIGVAFSYYAIAPDLLMSGGFLALAGKLFRRGTRFTPRAALFWGAFGGVLYLCKGAALPLVLIAALGAILIKTWDGELECRAAAVFLAFFGAGLALTAGPWITLLSLHYGKPTISTVAPIAHAIEGPWDYRPHGELVPGFAEILLPQPGRLNTWEEPSFQDFPYWSPFDGRPQLAHQLQIILRNARSNALKLVFLFGALMVFLRRYRREGRFDRICWASATIVGGNLLVYLPTHAASLRYFLPSFPPLILGLLYALEAVLAGRRARFKTAGIAAAALAASLLVLRPVGAMLLRPILNAEDYHPIGLRAREAAAELRKIGLGGPVVGGNPFGLYLSYFLRRPWYGGAEQAGLEMVAATGAPLVLVNRTSWNDGLRRELKASSDYKILSLPAASGMNSIGLPEVDVFAGTPMKGRSVSKPDP